MHVNDQVRGGFLERVAAGQALTRCGEHSIDPTPRCRVGEGSRGCLCRRLAWEGTGSRKSGWHWGSGAQGRRGHLGQVSLENSPLEKGKVVCF